MKMCLGAPPLGSLQGIHSGNELWVTEPRLAKLTNHSLPLRFELLRGWVCLVQHIFIYSTHLSSAYCVPGLRHMLETQK